MAAMGVVTLNTKAYSPRNKQGDVAVWALVGDATFGGATSFLTESVRTTTTGTWPGATKFQFKLDVPKAATASDTCACIGSTIGDFTLDIQGRVSTGLTAAEVTDVVNRAKDLVANAIFLAAAKGETSW